MMRHVTGLAAAISATVALWAVAPAVRADAEADCRRQIGPISEQIRGCSDVIRRDPKAAWAFSWRAHAYAHEREYDRAIADFSAAIALEPRVGTHYLNRGQLYLDGKRDYERAIADFNEHVRLDQDPVHGLPAFGFASRGRAYFLKGDADRGIADFRKAFELEPGSHSGSLYYYYDDYDDCKRIATELDEAIRQRPDEAFLYAWRGRIYGIMALLKGTTKRDRAIADFSAAIRLDPGLHWAYAQRAEAFHASGDDERANADLSEAIRLKPDGKYYYQRFLSHRDKGNHDQAIADISEVIKLHPKGYDANVRRGDLYRTKRDYDRAIADYDHVLANYKGSSESRATIFRKRAKTHFLKGDHHRAIADYDEALKSTQVPISVYVGRAPVYAALGDYERAIADYSKAIEFDPKVASHYDARAWAYLKAGKAAQGLPDAERALQLSPRYPRALNTRGHILEALGKREQAIADFREALRLDHALQASQEALKRLGATP